MPDTDLPAAIPGCDELELRELLRRCAASLPYADGALTPILGGRSNRAWRLDDGHGAAWFVRRGHPDAARLGVDRVSECRVLQAVAAAGLAPEVVACEPVLNLLVTRCIDGRTWRADDAVQPDNLARVAARLQLLHALPLPDHVRTVDYATQARSLDAALPAGDALATELRALAGPAFAQIRSRAPATVLCHHDLHHLNLIDDGARLWLVDWEYGGRGDPLLDVAGFLAMHDLSAVATSAFLEAYGRFGPEDLACVGAARWTFDYVQWLWYRLRFAGSGDEGAGHAERLAQRLLRCNNERLEQATG